MGIRYNTHLNADGELRRSKSEIIIDLLLTQNKLEYYYECPLGPYYPDFTIIINGKVFYWEHLGCLEDPKYLARWTEKKRWYIRNGHWDSVFITREKTGTIDLREIQNCLKSIIDQGQKLPISKKSRDGDRTLEDMKQATLRKEEMLQHPLQTTFPLNRAQVKTYREGWDRLAHGSLIVSPRNGHYYVLDGRHRWEAAPAGFMFNVVLLTGLTQEREAVLWKNYNVHRKNKTAIVRHLVDVASNEPMALLIDDLCRSIGRTMSHRGNSATNIACVDAIRRMVKTRGEEIVRRMFPVIGEIAVGKPIKNTLICGLVDLEYRIQQYDKEQSLTNPKWLSRLHRAGYDQIMEAVSKASVNGGSGDRKWAEQILLLLNRKMGAERKLIAYGINDT